MQAERIPYGTEIVYPIVARDELEEPTDSVGSLTFITRAPDDTETAYTLGTSAEVTARAAVGEFEFRVELAPGTWTIFVRSRGLAKASAYKVFIVAPAPVDAPEAMA